MEISKTRLLGVQVTEAEGRAIRQAAAQLDMGISPFMRALWIAYQQNPKAFSIMKQDNAHSVSSEAIRQA